MWTMEICALYTQQTHNRRKWIWIKWINLTAYFLCGLQNFSWRSAKFQRLVSALILSTQDCCGDWFIRVADQAYNYKWISQRKANNPTSASERTPHALEQLPLSSWVKATVSEKVSAEKTRHVWFYCNKSAAFTAAQETLQRNCWNDDVKLKCSYIQQCCLTLFATAGVFVTEPE